MDDVKKEMNPIEYDWTTMGDGRKHRDPVEEMMFYQAVASGSIGLVQDNCSRRVFEETECMGILSDDPVRNLKYHFGSVGMAVCPSRRHLDSATFTSNTWIVAKA